MSGETKMHNWWGRSAVLCRVCEVELGDDNQHEECEGPKPINTLRILASLNNVDADGLPHLFNNSSAFLLSLPERGKLNMTDQEWADILKRWRALCRLGGGLYNEMHRKVPVKYL